MGHHRSRVLLLASTSLTVLLASTAQAQDAKPTNEQAIEEVVVTGSRISRRDYVSESPIVTVSKAKIEAAGAITIEVALDQMPQFAGGSNGASNTANKGQANVNLRGLGNNRTLVLLDGRRMQPSGADGSVDVNTVPGAFLSGVEVITGGASAIYGSDAISGVVNFKLRSNFNGVELNAQYGVSERNDAETKQLGILVGGDFAEKRGNAVLGFEYSSRAAAFAYDRDFFRVSNLSGNLQSGIIRPTAANLPNAAAVNAVFARYGVAPGVVPNTVTFGFNTDGTLYSVSPAVHGLDRDPLLAISNNSYQNVAGYINYLQTPLTRYNVVGRTTYDLSEDIELYSQFYYTNSTAHLNIVSAAAGSLFGGQGAIPVPVTNPFIPRDLATILASRPNPTAPWLFSKRLNELGNRNETDIFNVYQILVGAKGDLKGPDWSWDVSASKGQTTNQQEVANYGSVAALTQLLTAPDGGRSLCAGGYNPFGLTSLSASCRTFLARTIHSSLKQDQSDVLANLQGGLFKLPAGQVRFAAGGEYRKNSYDFSPDGALQAGDIIAGAVALPANGSVSVGEIYGELLVPVLRDLPFVQELNLDLAYRYSHYNTAGGEQTYKASVDWAALSWLRLRGGYSRAIRAPSLSELFTPSSLTSETLRAGGLTGDPCDIRSANRAPGSSVAANVRALCLAQGVPAPIIDTFVNTAVQLTERTSGNQDLQPEAADTITAGFVIRPHVDSPWLDHATLSVDYYDIRVDHAIGSVTGLQALANCFNYNGTANPGFSQSNEFCALIARDPSSGIPLEAKVPLLNLGGYRTSGVDIQLDWDAAFDELGVNLPGALSLNAVVTHLNTFKIQSIVGLPFLDYAGTIGNLQINAFTAAKPAWKAQATVGYRVGPFATNLYWRYIDGMSNAANVGTPSQIRGVNSRQYFDWDGKWRVTDKFTLTLGVVNLANTKPPRVAEPVNTDIGVVGATDLPTYDVLGRRYYLRATARF